MKRLPFVFTLGFALAACEGDSKRLWAQHEIEDLVEDQVESQKVTIDNNAAAGNRLVDRIANLEAENENLKSQIDVQERQIRELYDNQSRLQNRLNSR